MSDHIGDSNKMVRINTLNQLYQAAQDRKSVIMPWRGGTRLPAAWVMNLQGTVLHQEMKDGIYLYRKHKTMRGKL